MGGQGSGRKPGSGSPSALDARLTVRLREDDLGWLAAQGEPGDVVRALIAAARAREEIEAARPPATR